MWTCTHKVNVDGGKTSEFNEGARHEGSIVQGYMVYQSMVYIIYYLPNLAKNINLPRIWHVKSINKFEG